jgi:hypothetical protein
MSGTTGKISVIRAPEVERHPRAEDVCDVHVRPALTGEAACHGPLEGLVAAEDSFGSANDVLLVSGAGLSNQPQPPDGIGLTYRERYEHQPALVASCLAGFLLVERDGHEGPQDQVLDVILTAAQQLSKAAGGCRHQDVVQFRVMATSDLLGGVEVAADDRQSAVPADRDVEAGPWRSLLEIVLAYGGPPLSGLMQGGGGPSELRQRAFGRLEAPTKVVLEQIAAGRHRRRGPGTGGRRGRIGARIEERTEQGHPRLAIGDGVVHLDVHGHPVAG